MKKHLFSGLILLFFLPAPGFSWVNFEPHPASEKNKVEQSLNAEFLKTLTLDQVLNLSPRNYRMLTGKKMSLKEKIALHFLQKQLKKDLKKGKKPDTENYAETVGFVFNLLGFLIGLVLGILGIIGVYVFSRNKDLRKSAWIGFAVWIVILLLII